MKIKYIFTIISLLFIISCAEVPDVTKQTYHFVTAYGYLNSINSIHADVNKAVCIDVNNKHVLDLKYRMESKGKYGDDPSSAIKNSYLKVINGRFFVDGLAMNVNLVDNRVLLYNTTIDDMVGIVDMRGIEQFMNQGEHEVSFYITAIEYSGSGTPTGEAETFGAVFGKVKFDSTGSNCNF